MSIDGRLNGFDLFGQPIARKASGPVAERFGVPPFSVLDARGGDWLERKRAWLSMGIKSELGRAGLGDTCATSMDYFNDGKTIAGDSGSIFDPMLCECVYRWWSGEGGQVVDPFAGGSVRGIVAAMLGRRYWGCDLRAEQVEANRAQAAELIGCAHYGPNDLTPVEEGDGVWVKRDDLCVVHGARGGKARTCWHLAQHATKGLTTAGSRSSPQAFIVASMAKAVGMPCVVHVPTGDISSGPVAEAVRLGAEVRQHAPGYNSVIVKRCREFAADSGYTEIPFGMECEEAVQQTRLQVRGLPAGVQRIVVPVGSGMSLAGVLHGLRDAGLEVPVLGVQVGASPEGRLDRYAPKGWRSMVQLVPAGLEYDEHVEATVAGVQLDPVYEAKCARHLQAGDLLWVVGHRDPVGPEPATGAVRPTWVCGDALEALHHAPPGDLLFTCPPYGDLERYSDDPKDLSTMGWAGFRDSYAAIIKLALQRLKQDRFGCFVVGDFRDERGLYRDFVSTTIAAFAAGGAGLYNDCILLTPVGTAAMRVTKQFEAGRKLVKTHQNVLVFCKGDWRRAAAACKEPAGVQPAVQVATVEPVEAVVQVDSVVEEREQVQEGLLPMLERHGWELVQVTPAPPRAKGAALEQTALW